MAAKKKGSRSLFRERDLARIFKVALAAGVALASVRIEPDGAIVLLMGAAAAPAPRPNPWD